MNPLDSTHPSGPALGTPPGPRYAVYAAPAPDSPGWALGSQWLGRCAATGAVLAQPPVPGVSAGEQERLTRAPRRYGWHATLKAPFRLAAGLTEADVCDALQRWCARTAPVDLPPVRVAWMGNFLALVPGHPSRELQALASTCVRDFHPLAAPLTPADLARRRQAGLTPREDELLLQWGYPRVMELFRCHWSLTGPLTGESQPTRQALQRAAEAWFAADVPQAIDALSLFVEPAPGADFRWLCRVPLTG